MNSHNSYYTYLSKRHPIPIYFMREPILLLLFFMPKTLVNHEHNSTEKKEKRKKSREKLTYPNSKSNFLHPKAYTISGLYLARDCKRTKNLTSQLFQSQFDPLFICKIILKQTMIDNLY